MEWIVSLLLHGYRSSAAVLRGAVALQLKISVSRLLILRALWSGSLTIDFCNHQTPQYEKYGERKKTGGGKISIQGAL